MSIQPQPPCGRTRKARMIWKTPLAMNTAATTMVSDSAVTDRIDPHGDAADEQDDADDQLPGEAAPASTLNAWMICMMPSQAKMMASTLATARPATNGMPMAKTPPMMKQDTEGEEPAPVLADALDGGKPHCSVSHGSLLTRFAVR